MLDWDRPNITIQIAEDLRAFPRIMIAQVHGYCLGGALGIMNCHDIVFAAEDAQLGMPEVLRGSFGQLVTSTLMHSGLPVKKLSLIALGGKNVTGKEADALGIISQAVPADKLEAHTIAFARDLATRHLAPLEHHKITVQMGRDLSLSQAIQLDQLVGAAAAPRDGPARRRRGLSQVAEGRREFELQAAGRYLSVKLSFPPARGRQRRFSRSSVGLRLPHPHLPCPMGWNAGAVEGVGSLLGGDEGQRSFERVRLQLQAGVDLGLIGAERGVAHVRPDDDIAVAAQQRDGAAAERARQRLAECAGLDQEIGHARGLAGFRTPGLPAA